LTNQCIRAAFLSETGVTKTAEPYNSLNLATRADEKAWFDATVSLYIRPPTATEVVFKSIVISDANFTATRFVDFKPDLVLTWQVLNNLTIQLLDPNTDPAHYLRSYENELNIFVDRMLKETRARVVIGNAPDVTAMWYFKPCFTPEVLRKVQADYNNIISNVAKKNPTRVFVADLSNLPLGRYSQFLSVEDGLWFTVQGHREVAKIFGDVIRKLGITAPASEPSFYYPGSPVAGTTGAGGGATTAGGGGAPTTAAPPPGNTTPAGPNPGNR
jgi:hypothetical protein